MNMNKRKLSVMFLIFYIAVMVLSLVGCGEDEAVRGISVDRVVSDRSYNDVTNLTSLTLEVFATNNNGSHAITSYKYRVIFRDCAGNTLSSREYTQYDGLTPGNTDSFTYSYQEANGTAVRGEVVSVEIVPVQMTLSNEEVDSSGSKESPKWGFWAWFWVIVSGILVFLFITCCIGAEGDSDAIIGGVVIFLAPAILILVIYFGFVFGH